MAESTEENKVFKAGSVVTEQAMNEMFDFAQTAKTVAGEANSTAGLAKGIAESAKTTAGLAKTAAQAAAQAAEVKATNAEASAANAEASAVKAEVSANNAANSAKVLQDTMGDRLTSVEASNAQTVIDVGQAIIQAESAIQDANIAIDDANDAKDNANSTIANVNTALGKVNTAVDKVQSAIDDARIAKEQSGSAQEQARSAQTKSIETERLVKVIKGEAVNAYNEQYITGKKVFKEIYAGNYKLKPLAFLGSNSTFANVGAMGDMYLMGEYYYITVYDKRKFENVNSRYMPSIIKYNYRTKCIEKIIDIKPIKYVNAIVGSFCVTSSGEIYGLVMEDNGVYESVGNLSCINLFKYNPNGTNNSAVVSQFNHVDGKEIEPGMIKLGYDYAIVGEGDNMEYIKTSNNKLVMASNRAVYSYDITEGIVSKLCEIDNQYSIVNGFNCFAVQNYIWMVVNYGSSDKQQLLRYDTVEKKFFTYRFPSGERIAYLCEDVQLGYMYFFSESNRIYEISTIVPISIVETVFTKPIEQNRMISCYTKPGEIYLLTKENIYNNNVCNVGHMNIIDKELVKLCDVDLSDINSIRLFVGDDDGIVIKDNNHVRTYCDPLSVQEYMDNIDLKVDHLQGVVGDTVNSDYRYTELRDSVNVLNATAVKKDDKISLLNNDRQYQTSSEVSSAIYTALEDYTPSGGGGGSAPSARVVWQGRVREDEIYTYKQMIINNGSNIRKQQYHVWDFTPLQYMQFDRTDKIKVYLETNEISDSNVHNYVDKIELLYENISCENVNILDIDPDYTGEPFVLTVIEFCLSASNFKIKDARYDINYDSNGAPGQNYIYKDNFVFADFAKLICTTNMDKYCQYMMSQGASATVIEEELGLMGENATNCRLGVDRYYYGDVENSNRFWNYGTSRAKRTAIARLNKPTGDAWDYNVYANINGSSDLPQEGEDYFYYFTKIEVIK